MINLTSPPPVVGGGTSDAPLITGVDVEGISAHEQMHQRILGGADEKFHCLTCPILVLSY